MTSSLTSKVWSGSNPSTFFVAATSSSPSAEPCTPPVFILLGAGYPMIVRSAMNDGLSVTFLASAIACSMATTFSPPSISCTCHP